MQRLPTAITSAPMRTVRPVMLRGVYANPEKEVVRIQRQGLLKRIAPGTYTAVPDTVAPGDWWIPVFEEAAMAYATAAYGDRVPILVGLGAARHWHAVPRAIGVTVVAVPEQHRGVDLLTGGHVVFTTRNVDKIDALPVTGNLGTFLVSTIEQTMIELILRPNLGGMASEALAAVPVLHDRADPERLSRLLGALSKVTQRRIKMALRGMGERHVQSPSQ